MTEKEIICVICPQSCHIRVTGDGKEITSMEGYKCRRGEEYAAAEYVNPVRTLTSTVKAEGYSCPVILVRSSRPIPKSLMFEAMKIVRETSVTAPFKVGRVVIENILETGADIVLTNE